MTFVWVIYKYTLKNTLKWAKWDKYTKRICKTGRKPILVGVLDWDFY